MIDAEIQDLRRRARAGDDGALEDLRKVKYRLFSPHRTFEDGMKAWQDLADRHGFRHKSPRSYKRCVVIKFDYGRWNGKGPCPPAYNARANEKTDFMFRLFDIFEEEANGGFRIFEQTEHRLAGVGIYATSHWDRPHWAVPYENAEVLAWVRKNVPKWAVLREKP